MVDSTAACVRGRGINHLGRFGLRVGLLARRATAGLGLLLRRCRLDGFRRGEDRGLLPLTLVLVDGLAARATGLRLLGLGLLEIGVRSVLVGGVVAVLGDVLIGHTGLADPRLALGLVGGLERRQDLLLPRDRGRLRVALAAPAAVAALA